VEWNLFVWGCETFPGGKLDDSLWFVPGQCRRQAAEMIPFMDGRASLCCTKRKYQLTERGSISAGFETDSD